MPIGWTERNGTWTRDGAKVRLSKASGSTFGWRVTFDDGRRFTTDTADRAKAYADEFLGRQADFALRALASSSPAERGGET